MEPGPGEEHLLGARFMRRFSIQEKNIGVATKIVTNIGQGTVKDLSSHAAPVWSGACVCRNPEGDRASGNLYAVPSSPPVSGDLVVGAVVARWGAGSRRARVVVRARSWHTL